MVEFMLYFVVLKKKCEVILCGDVNIVYKEIDIKNWKSNQKNLGCLLEECEWFMKLFDDVGYVDVFCMFDLCFEQYMWWSNCGQVYVKNVGWWIDYQIVILGVVGIVKSMLIFKDIKFSDYVLLMVDYDYQK